MDDVGSDRISTLPNNVIKAILSRLPLRDVVKTSILSTGWKLHWTRISSLKFGRRFYFSLFPDGKEDKMTLHAYLNVVWDVLLSHRGPVRKFCLYIPHFERIFSLMDIDLIILHVSECRVEDLKLKYEVAYDENTQVFPCSVFRCVKLKHLALRRVQTLPAHNFKKLSYLVSLDWCQDFINGELVTNIISNCPLLEKLLLQYEECEHLDIVISAPKLKLLLVAYGGSMEFSLKCTPNVTEIVLFACEGRIPHEAYENIASLLKSVPKVETMTLGGGVFSQWNQNFPERLPALLKNHLTLNVLYFNMYSEEQFRCMFCLIKNSPNLETLDFSANYRLGKPDAAYNYLKSEIENDDELESLKTVKIDGLIGEKIEMIFIATVLWKCPNLQKLYLRNGSHTLIPDPKSTLMAVIDQTCTDIVSVSQAQIIYL